jgi:beta-N-acetylhexosaminidase
LREDLGFENLAITDDLEMGAVINNYGIGEACKLALKAGNDLLAICANPQAVRDGFQAVLDGFKTGEIPESRIDQSLGRISRVKANLSKPLTFDDLRLQNLSDEIALLNKKISYTYGG